MWRVELRHGFAQTTTLNLVFSRRYANILAMGNNSQSNPTTPPGSFEQEFLQKVKGAAKAEAEAARPKRKIDPKLLVAVILGGAVLIGLVALLIQRGGGQGQDSFAELNVVGAWSCDDESKMDFGDDGSLVWTFDFGQSEVGYFVNGDEVIFGNTRGFMDRKRLMLSLPSGNEVICERRAA